MQRIFVMFWGGDAAAVTRIIAIAAMARRRPRCDYDRSKLHRIRYRICENLYLGPGQGQSAVPKKQNCRIEGPVSSGFGVVKLQEHETPLGVKLKSAPSAR